MLIGGLILLGLIASMFLIFSSSVQLIRIGLVAALWAAVFGALAATRYRRESATDQAKVHGLQTMYQLQLEREIAARREYELGVEVRVRQEVGAEAAEMAALRTELTALRESLQRLFDGDLPADRPALHADAVRLQELPSSAMADEDPANDNPEETDGWDAWSSPVVPRYPVTPVFEPDHPEPPAFASPFDEPVTAETSVVTADDVETAEADMQLDTEILDRGELAVNSYRSPDPAGYPDAPPAPDPLARSTTSIGTSGSHRRRREPGEDHPSRKLSVAEIMANLQSERGAG